MTISSGTRFNHYEILSRIGAGGMGEVWLANDTKLERKVALKLLPAALTQDAAQRLSALSDYTELGAGFKIAMRDLEIRGAGNLLGDEQSGHVAALGFELYMQMLDEAVAAAEDGAWAGDEWEPAAHPRPKP